MNNKHQKYWDAKHLEEEELAKISSPSVFVELAARYFPPEAQILELGAGTGQDTHFLVDHGFQVTATDFSKPALDLNWETANAESRSRLQIQQFDLSEPFPFSDLSFDALYTHLVVHYFDRQTTQQIFDEISRVLRPGGIVALLVNSVNDPEYGQGRKIEEDFFELKPGRPKRYFSVESLRPFVSKFKTVILDNKGSDPRRSHKNGLIRFIGKRV